MDHSESQWAPRRALVGLGWALAVLTGVVAVFTALSGDRPGSFLLGIGMLALTGAAVHGTFVRPRLAAHPWGVCIRTIGGTQRITWSQVRVDLITTRRLGRDVPMLELETEELVVFGWIELGTDPRDVHDVLLTLRKS